MLLQTHFVQPPEEIMEEARISKQTLFDRTGEGAEMTDWLDWPEKFIISDEYKRLKETAKMIRGRDSAVIVIGIGGSYLGARAVIESEYGSYYNELTDGPRIYFAGNDLSTDGMKAISDLIEYAEYSIIYISKSGGTIEPALAFRYFYNKLVEDYGQKNADERVIAITGKSGILHNLAEAHNWQTFAVPEGIGGRYSVLTPVGMLPIAIAGIDTDALLEGAKEAMTPEGIDFATDYAMHRMTQYSYAGCKVEFLAVNSQRMQYFGEWFKQLFAESEGKDEKGIFPTSGIFPTDLHSVGQYLQSGTKNLIFETQVIRMFNNRIDIPEGDASDGLDKYLGKTINDAANAAMEGAGIAHKDGGMCVGKIYVGNSTKAFGYLLQVMMTACGISAYMLGVNPFDQPGVEQHKIAMKKTLSK